MNISIVISNYDSKGQLEACVDAALGQAVDGGDFEVILPLHGEISAAEGSRLEARAVQAPRLRLLRLARDNRAYALNEAVKAARSDCLVFVESHVLAPPGLAAACGRLLESPGVAAIQGAYVARPSANWVAEVETVARTAAGARRGGRGLTADEFHIHSACFRRDVLLDAGGFDERVPGIAEVPLLQRIADAGGCIEHLQAPAVSHVNHEDMPAYLKALRRRAVEVGLLWRIDPGMAGRTYPSGLVGRYGALVRMMRVPIGLAVALQVCLVTASLRLARATGSRRFAAAAALRAVTAAVRGGFLRGYSAPGRGVTEPSAGAVFPSVGRTAPRILFQTRPDHATRVGGDAIVIEALRDQLTARGFRVDVSGAVAPPLARYDAVHLFNLELMPHTFLQADNARRWARPCFLTPIYWTPEESVPWRSCPFPENAARLVMPRLAFDALALALVARRLPEGSRSLAGLPSLSRQRLREAVLLGAIKVFASCEAERSRLLRDFPRLAADRVIVARFGYRPAPPSDGSLRPPEPGYFLCVGAFGPRKNQLNIARAFRGMPGVRLVFVGDAAAGNAGYYQAVRTAAPPGTLFLPGQPHGALPALYAGARAVVQASCIELPGLVAMEALANRCPVVVSDRAPSREYFEGLASFADPGSPESIRRTCLAAKPPDPVSVARFVARHDWTAVSWPVMEAYRSLST